MRNLLYVSALVALGGCMNEEKFGEKLGEKMCDEMATCNPDLACDPDAAAGDTDAAEDSTCDFDRAAANECLDGTFKCEDFGGIKMVVAPEVCATVCGAGDDTDAATDTDTDPAT